MRETRFPAHDVAFAAVWDERAPRVSTGSAPALVVRHSRRKMMATLALGLGIVPIAVAMGVTATGSDDRVADASNDRGSDAAARRERATSN